jgi:hypothetical protein
MPNGDWAKRGAPGKFDAAFANKVLGAGPNVGPPLGGVAAQIRQMHLDEVPLDEMVDRLGLSSQLTPDERDYIQNELTIEEVKEIRKVALEWLKTVDPTKPLRIKQINGDPLALDKDTLALEKDEIPIRCNFDPSKGGHAQIHMTKGEDGEAEIIIDAAEPSSSEIRTTLERLIRTPVPLIELYEHLGLDTQLEPEERAGVDQVSDKDACVVRRLLLDAIREGPPVTSDPKGD